MGKILSIIIPTYNMENYLRKGLDSLLISKGLEFLEVVIVNDGSRDNSSKIAHEYENRYPDVFIVIDKLNGNYGSCINAGLKIVTGKYVKVLDADDSFITENLEKLVNVLLNVDVDLVFSDYIKTFTSGKVIEYKADLPANQICRIENVYNTQAFYNIQLPAITYRTELIKRMNYHQTEGISYTDTEWVFSPVIHVKTVYYTNVFVYRYLMGREGQTMDPKIMVKAMPQKLQCFSSLLRSISGVELSECMKQFTSGQLVKHAFYIYEFYLISNSKMDRSSFENFDEEFKVQNPLAYQQCEKFQFRLHIPYFYVKKWRENRKDIPKYIRLFGFILDILGTIHVKFMRTNPNEPR